MPAGTRSVARALEDQGRSDAAGGDGRKLSLGVSGEEEETGPGEPRTSRLRVVRSAGVDRVVQGGDDPLSWSSVLPAVLDDLEVGACAGVLGAEEDGALVVGTP